MAAAAHRHAGQTTFYALAIFAIRTFFGEQTIQSTARLSAAIAELQAAHTNAPISSAWLSLAADSRSGGGSAFYHKMQAIKSFHGCLLPPDPLIAAYLECRHRHTINLIIVVNYLDVKINKKNSENKGTFSILEFGSHCPDWFVWHATDEKRPDPNKVGSRRAVSAEPLSGLHTRQSTGARPAQLASHLLWVGEKQPTDTYWARLQWECKVG